MPFRLSVLMWEGIRAPAGRGSISPTTVVFELKGPERTVCNFLKDREIMHVCNDTEKFPIPASLHTSFPQNWSATDFTKYTRDETLIQFSCFYLSSLN